MIPSAQDRHASFRKPVRIVLYNYLDHRTFLLDLIEHFRKNSYHFSLRNLAHAAGFSTPNIFQQIIQGRRKLNDEGISKIASLLHLNGNEQRFFENLVKMGQALTHCEKDRYFRLLSSSPRYAVLNRNDKKVYRYYSHWYYPVIREMVVLKGFCPDPGWIARRITPSISTAEAARALKALEHLGQLRKTRDAYLQQDPVITTGEEVSSVAVTNYHKSMIQKASESLDRFPHQKRNVSSLTFAASRGAYESIVMEIYQFQRKIIDMLERDQGADEIFQLNFQVFPCTDSSDMDGAR